MTCQKTVEPGLGDCCCNCANQRPLMSHPWVNGFPCTHQIGWVCLANEASAIWLKQHGNCEMHTSVSAPDQEKS